jgi:hypothetical protein
MSSRSLAASTELALRLGARPGASGARGEALQLVLTHEWLDRNKRRGELTASELRVKQAFWEWFAALEPARLESVRPPRGARTRADAASAVLADGGRTTQPPFAPLARCAAALRVPLLTQCPLSRAPFSRPAAADS